MAGRLVLAVRRPRSSRRRSQRRRGDADRAGERAHLLRPDFDRDTHISDIAALFEYRDLHDVILVGHSYGGTVITAVAERVADRIRQLVYLDASVPREGGRTH
jgi:pimeloyl-ACP methyl ester carboxylesterase